MDINYLNSQDGNLMLLDCDEDKLRDISEKVFLSENEIEHFQNKIHFKKNSLVIKNTTNIDLNCPHNFPNILNKYLLQKVLRESKNIKKIKIFQHYI